MITGNITCNYYMEVYVDGRKTGYNEDYLSLNHQTIDIGSNVIAVKCRCKLPPCGGTIIASFDNGLVTDTSWKCTTQLHTGWYFEHFDDSGWNAAESNGLNNMTTMPWGEIANISGEAHFIWTTSSKDDHVVYCRKRLVEKCTKGIVHSCLGNHKVTSKLFMKPAAVFMALSISNKNNSNINNNNNN